MKPKSVAEQRHLDRLAGLPCIVGELGFKAECGGRLEIHHLREGQGAGLRGGHFTTIRACVNHHTGPFGIHLRKAFYTRTKLDEMDLLDAQLERLEELRA